MFYINYKTPQYITLFSAVVMLNTVFIRGNKLYMLLRKCIKVINLTENNTESLQLERR